MGAFTSSNASTTEETKVSGCPCHTTSSEPLASYTKSRGGSLKCKYADGGFVKYTKKSKPTTDNTMTATLQSGDKVYCIDTQTEVSYK